ncbi:MAG: hypothetical protein R3266_07700 [Gemmatimonadota bacterium]|nr:hypothetical protein [Gemmatimonadota bacterium]
MDTEKPYPLSEGLLVGLVGYATVVVVVAGLDLLSGRALFHTPGLLGRGLVADPGPPGSIAAGAVLAYNGLHLLAFLVIGIGVLQLARLVEVHPVAWFLAYFVCVAGFFVVEMTITVIDPEGEALSWWAILLATAAAAFAMGIFLNRRHPALWRRISRDADRMA